MQITGGNLASVVQRKFDDGQRGALSRVPVNQMQHHDELTERRMTTPPTFSFGPIRIVSVSLTEPPIIQVSTSFWLLARSHLLYSGYSLCTSMHAGKVLLMLAAVSMWSLARIPARCLKEENKGDWRITPGETETVDLDSG